jgi:hypothetical protein
LNQLNGRIIHRQPRGSKNRKIIRLAKPAKTYRIPQNSQAFLSYRQDSKNTLTAPNPGKLSSQKLLSNPRQSPTMPAL